MGPLVFDWNFSALFLGGWAPSKNRGLVLGFQECKGSFFFQFLKRFKRLFRENTLVCFFQQLFNEFFFQGSWKGSCIVQAGLPSDHLFGWQLLCFLSFIQVISFMLGGKPGSSMKNKCPEARKVLSFAEYQRWDRKQRGFVVGGLQDPHVKRTNCQKLTWKNDGLFGSCKMRMTVFVQWPDLQLVDAMILKKTASHCTG